MAVHYYNRKVRDMHHWVLLLEKQIFDTYSNIACKDPTKNSFFCLLIDHKHS